MNTYEKLINVMNSNLDLDFDASKFERDDDLTEDIDSLTFIKLLVAVDEEFGISIEDDDFDLENFNTINAIINYIESHQ